MSESTNEIEVGQKLTSISGTEWKVLSVEKVYVVQPSTGGNAHHISERKLLETFEVIPQAPRPAKSKEVSK